MRPVNLIPVEDRRGGQAPLRSGPLAYILLGALVALLVGVTALVLTSNQISEKESEIVTLEAEDSRAEAQATVTRELEHQTVSPEMREKLILAEQQYLFEMAHREVLAEATLASLRHSVARDLTPEGVLRNRVRFDPATESVVGDGEAAKLARPLYRDPWEFPKQYLG